MFFLLQVYEISIEATFQFFLQSGVLLYEMFYTNPSEFDFMLRKDHTLEIVSIFTSFLSIMWGLSSFKINVTQAEPKFLDKLVLMLRSSVDIIARLNSFKLYIIFFYIIYFVLEKLQ